MIGGVSGWVRNRPEGTVEAVFEGASAAVEKVIEWCHLGSPMSQVADVAVAWEDFSGEYENFRITY